MGNNPAGYTYDVFGAIRSQSRTGDTDFKFTGEQLDSDSSFYYLRARYYDPAIGRFLGQDPVPSGNLYAYAGNNPVTYSDPSGMCPNSCEGTFTDPSAITGRIYNCGYGDVSCVLAYIQALIDFVYHEFLPWWQWVRDCNVKLLAAGALFGGGSAGLFTAGIFFYEYFAANLTGLELLHVMMAPSLAAAPAGGLVLAVVASDAFLRACGDRGIFARLDG